MKKFTLFILFTFITFSFIVGQNLVATGISNQSQIRNIITNAGFTIQDEQLSNINSSTLAEKQVLALFNGSQTWNGTQLFTTSQANDIVNFVQNGGYLYISSRKGYDNLLSQFGVTTNGNDGGSSGFDWPLIELSATQFSSHPITQDLTSVVGDVGANFTTDENWTIIGEDNSGTDLLAVRNYGIGKVVLWYGQRSYRDPGASGNVYETDITEGSNTQYHINLFTYFSDLTDISTIKYSLETNIYPNPANQSFSVTGNNITSVEIFNFQGQYISFYKVSTLPLTINISNLKNGIYIVRISSDRFSSIKKLIKQ